MKGFIRCDCIPIIKLGGGWENLAWIQSRLVEETSTRDEESPPQRESEICEDVMEFFRNEKKTETIPV